MKRSVLMIMLATVALSGVPIPASVAQTTPAPLPPGGSFVDDDNNVHEGNIEAIAEAAITLGCNPPANDRYCPADTVTRGEMAAFLKRALGLVDQAEDPFSDDDDSIFEADIERVAAAGITLGCNPPSNDRYCPDRAVSRGEMAAFLVRAYNYVERDVGRFVDDDGSIFEADIERLATAGVTLGCNPPENDRFCPLDPVRRDEMASFLVRAEGLTPIEVPPRLTPTLVALPFDFDQPIQVTAPVGDPRLFVVERPGTVRVVMSNDMLPQPFLDIDVVEGGERGLLSIAFPEDFLQSQRVYVSYSAPSTTGDHRSVIEEFAVVGDQVDPDSGRIVFETVQPYSNHNGGMIMFGPDGYLYLGLGDGGGSFDPGRNGQDAATALGSMVRIDVDAATSENWAIGVRNPWRFWISGTDMYIADVGQGTIEEVSVVSTLDTGLNLGWVPYEGTRYTGIGSSSTAGLTFPVVEYGHDEGCSITGGVVYQGLLSQIDGHFLYGDYCAGWIRSVQVIDGAIVGERNLSELGTAFGLTSFGVDGGGNTYVIRSGTVYQLGEE